MTDGSYIVTDDIPLGKFEGYVLPPMPAKDVCLLLAEGELPAKLSSEIRRLLINELISPNQKRSEVEQWVDGLIADLAKTINHG